MPSCGQYQNLAGRNYGTVVPNDARIDRGCIPIASGFTALPAVAAKGFMGAEASAIGERPGGSRSSNT